MNSEPERTVGCDAVNEHVSRPIPETLWHYTSFAGFQGIVTSKTIWATEYRFLNDREEFLHAKRLADRLVDEEPEFVGYQFPVRDILRKAVGAAFNTGYLHEERLRVMVVSFTEEGDQLSQWRGYANNSRGVSIGLDVRHLRPPLLVGTAVTLAPCLYPEEDKRRVLKAIFAHHRKGLERWWNLIVDVAREETGKVGGMDPNLGRRLVAEHQPELNTAVAQADASLRFDLLRTALLLKNESFREEREWRLVLPLEPIRLPSHHRLQFRYVADNLVPYIAYPLRSPNQDGPIPCKGVVVGPGSHPSARVGVNLFLHSEGIMLLALESKIPYRPT
jgi:hypothetical protein